jgi:hypothetical protein
MRLLLRVLPLLVLSALVAPPAFGDAIVPASATELVAEHPGVGLFHSPNGQLSTVYGPAFSFGVTPEDSAEQFLARYADVWGVDSVDLMPYGPVGDGLHTLPLMFDRDMGDYKFTLVYFTQHVGDLPVYGADIRLLVRNEPGFPLVLVTSGLRNLGDFRGDAGLGGRNFEAAKANAALHHPGLMNFEVAQDVIWAGTDELAADPGVAFVFHGWNEQTSEDASEKWLFVADARTGEIRYEENQVLHVDVTGNVSGLATQGNGADICDPEAQEPMPYAFVQIVSGNSAYADVNGDFVISNGGTQQVTVQSPVRGRYFQVQNQGQSNTVLSQNVTPPGPANFLHNSANDNEFVRAEVNGYVESNVVRDFVLDYAPNYPTISTQTNFTVNVNLAQTCNAFYNGSSINFYRSGGGCSNTANTTVVHHEYGHHVVATGGSGQGAYGEGLGDVLGVLLTDDPILAYGFQNNCNAGIRNANNTMEYPCSGEIHFCGQLLSGCVWSTRNELLISNPNTYLDILSNLAVNAVPLHRGTGIAPDITVHYLTLDDDDGNIENGTPHYPEIAAGFGAHNMDAPPLQLASFVYPDGHPDLVSPNQTTDIRVDVEPLTGTPVPGSGRIHYRVNNGAWQDVAMAQGNPNEYTGTLPGTDCTDVISYYFSARVVEGNQTITDPPNAPTGSFSVVAATGQVIAFEDNFETNQGWTAVNLGATSGDWQRGVPVNDPGWDYDPASDGDGSGSCYLTQNQNGNTDVDDGAVQLVSPQFDMSSGGDISYYYYLYLTRPQDNNDVLLVEINSNGGTGGWTQIARHNSNGNTSWRPHTITQQELVNQGVSFTDRMVMRFTANDANQQSIVESGVDGLKVFAYECGLEGDTVLASSFEVTRGQLVSGTIDDLGASDDQDVEVEARLPSEIAANSVEIEVTGTATTDSPSGIAFAVEAATSGDPTVQKIELYNYDTQLWEMVSERGGPNSDTVTQVIIRTDASRFVEAGTREVKARVGFGDRGVNFPSWGGTYDQVFWTIAQ